MYQILNSTVFLIMLFLFFLITERVENTQLLYLEKNDHRNSFIWPKMSNLTSILQIYGRSFLNRA